MLELSKQLHTSELPIPAHMHNAIMRKIRWAKYKRLYILTTFFVLANLIAAGWNLYENIRHTGAEIVFTQLWDSFEWNTDYMSLAYTALANTLSIAAVTHFALSLILLGGMIFIWTRLGQTHKLT
jgi:hypothetical protein